MAGQGLGNALDGASSNAGYVNSSCAAPTPDIFGTALDMSTFDDAKICAQITDNLSASELEEDVVGCGASAGFSSSCRLGQREYRVGLAGDLGYENGFDRILAQFFGQVSAPAEQNAGENDCLHTFTFAQIANEHFGTFAYETSRTDVIELPSVYTEGISINMSSINNYVRWGANLVSNDFNCVTVARATANTDLTADVVNQNAQLQALTVGDRELVFPECNHTLRLKEILDDGTDTALVAADQFNITSFELEMNTPLETIDEMTGGVCNGATQSDRRNGTLTLGVKEHSDNGLTYCAWRNGTTFMAELEWTGKQIGTGALKTFRIKLPKLCLAGSPGYNITNAGKNPFNLVFRILESENILPLTGQTTQAPEIDIINGRKIDYLQT